MVMSDKNHQSNDYRGYVGSRLYGGQRIPQHIQNLVIRDYAKRHQLNFLLSLTEYCMPDCFMMLHDAVESLGECRGIILYSIYLLPERASQRQKIYEKTLAAGGEIHAAVEDISIKNEKDVIEVENILRVQNALRSGTPFMQRLHSNL